MNVRLRKVGQHSIGVLISTDGDHLLRFQTVYGFKLGALAVTAVLGFASFGHAAFAQAGAAYRDATASTESRVADLLKRMTLEEKVAQLEGVYSLPFMAKAPGVFDGANIDTQQAEKVLGSGIRTYAFLGDFAGEAGTPQEAVQRRNLLQKWVLENTRLGIPVLFHGEALHGAVFRGATTFPEVVKLGSTWDPQLIREMFGVVAEESRAIGNAIVLAPSSILAAILGTDAMRRCIRRILT